MPKQQPVSASLSSLLHRSGKTVYSGSSPVSKSFIGWECEGDYHSPAPVYDKLIMSFLEILKKYSLHGYHCTRLTEEEIVDVKENGLKLRNTSTLYERVNKLLTAHLIRKNVAQSLLNNNQSGDNNRANMLWFCFFPPYLGGQHGIERFFRHWGGEALYNSHEENPVTGKRLQKIGIPCVVEALVPLGSMPNATLPDGQFIRSYLKEKGYSLENGLEYESYITDSLNPANIIEVHQFPSKTFIELTECDYWDDPLS